MKEQYVITLNRPPGVSITQMKTYISEAVRTWGGQYHPDDPMFGFHENVHSVKRVKAKATGAAS